MKRKGKNMARLSRHTSGLVTVFLTGLMLCCQPQSGRNAGKVKGETSPTITTPAKAGKKQRHPVHAKTTVNRRKAGTVPSKKTAGSKAHTESVLNIQGYHIGMTQHEVKRMLRKRDIREYATGFSDVYVYNSSPDTEVRLTFACSSRGNVLAKIELTMLFSVQEGGQTVSTLQKKLIDKYGKSAHTNAPADGLDMCWGQCGQQAGGTAVRARTAALKGEIRSLVLSLSDGRLEQACNDMRQTRINTWMQRWIAAVQHFRLGMTMKEASELYLKRFGCRLVVDKNSDPELNSLKYYWTKDYDFFAGLDFDSQSFEGEEPGTIVLKFTGDQAGDGDALNKRLYYTFFSTTKFTDRHVYADLQQKLDTFITSYGPPTAVIHHPDGVTARWGNKAQQRSVGIFDSGLMIFEQLDLSLKNAYRDAALREINRNDPAKFDRAIF